MALMKQGQGLVETSDEEIKKQSGFTPLSPAAVKTQGGTPQQAAMAGTPAAKQSLYKPLEDTQKTLQQAQRQTQMLDKQRQQAQDQAAAKMDRLKQLGTMGAQIEGLIQQRLGSQQGATSGLATQNIAAPVINQAAIDLLPETQRAAAAAALQAYASAADVNAKQQALVSLSAALNRPVKDSDIGDYFQQLPELATAAAKQAVGTSITLGNLQPSWLNVQQTAADLGISEQELQGYTPEQLQAKLQEVESNEYNRIANLKAEYATAVGARKLQIQNELTQLGQAGATGTEAQFDRMQQAVDEGQTLMVGGQEMSIEDILTKDSLSNLISDAASNPQALAELKRTPGYEALAGWIESNQTELNELATGMRSDVRSFEGVQSNLADIQSNLGNLSSVILGDIPQYATQAQLDELNTKLASSGLYQSIQADPGFKAQLEANPKLAEQLKNKTKEEIDNLKSITDMVKNNGDIAAAFGLNEGEFVTDPDKASTFVATANVLSNAPKEVDEQQKLDIARMVADGDVTLNVVESLMQHPGEIADVVSENAAIKEYNTVKDDFDKFSEWAFGGTKPDDINKLLSGLESVKNFGTAKEQQDADRVLNLFKKYVGADGRLDKSDMPNLLAALKSTGLDKVATGGGTIAEQLASLKQMGQDATALAANDKVQGMVDIIAGGVTFDELSNPDNATTLDLLAGNAYFKMHFPDSVKVLNNIKEVRNLFSTSNPAIGEKLISSMKDGMLDTAEVKAAAKKMSIEEIQALLNSKLPFQSTTKNEVVSSVLGHKKYGNVKYDAKDELQKILDNKVDSELQSYPGFKSASKTTQGISTISNELSGKSKDSSIKGTIGWDAGKAYHDKLATQDTELSSAITEITASLANLPAGALKTQAMKKLEAARSALQEIRWWRTNLKETGWSSWRVATPRDPYKG